MELEMDLRELSILNPSPLILEGPKLLHDLVTKSSNDSLPAIDYHCSTGAGFSVTYHELHSAATALATRMLEILRPPDSVDCRERLVIPILIPQSPALYVGLLAILKIGAAFCPLNVDIPQDRLKFILSDVKAELVLVDSKLATRIPDDDAYRILPVNRSLDLLLCNTGQPVPCSYRVPEPDDLAYVMYTSGSTGTPKGVAISHRAVTQSLLAHDRHIPPFARFLQFAAPTFDVSVFEIFYPLFRGSTLVCSSRADMLSDLPGVLRDSRVDACELTPSVAGSLLKKRSNAPELRLLLTIGEMLTEPVIQEFGGDDDEGSLLWGMYGPTEATIHCTIQPSFSKKSSKNNIGIPLDTVSAFIIDSDIPEFRVLPLGQVGELAIGGSQVAIGYINRPEQTSAAFLDTSWGRVYRTGDKARILPDGTIECLGRIGGGQVKLNGQRIELGEVEHALLRTPGCHGALAVIISNVLVAFAAVERDARSTGMRAAIFSQCRSWLPAFMIPADLKIVEHFPRLPSGKVDKRSLIEQYETSTSHDSDAGEAFEDELERQLCETAEVVLGQRVAPSTYLPSLGMDSLAAIEYASAIQTSGITIDTISILDVTTVRELIRVIKDRHSEVHSSSSTQSPLDQLDQGYLADFLASEAATQVHPRDVERVEPCSPLQEAMVAETLKDARLYINQTELRFPNHLTVESIESWFVALAQRNEILRTGFAYLNDKLYQVVWEQLEDSQIEVLNHIYSFECADVEHFLRRPFKISIVPSHASATYHAVVITLHHSIYDGWTIDLLIEDLSFLARDEPPVDRPQFRKVCQHLAAPLENEIDAKEFWAGKLRGYAPTSLPNFRTSAVRESQIITAYKEIKVDPILVRDSALGASVGSQVIFQACLSWLWGAINGVSDTIIGSVSSGRTLPIAGVEKIMGPCMTTLPIRTILSEYTTVIELLQGIHMFNRETLRYGGLSLSDIKRAAGIPPAQKLFDVIFAYQETLASRKRIDNIVYEAWHKDAVETKLLVEITPSDSSFSCQLTWHSDAFSHPQVDVLFRHLDSLVRYFIENGDRPLSSVSRCFPVDDLSRHNEIPKTLQIASSLSELVEEAALKYSTNDALCFASLISTSDMQSHNLTYRELNSRANQIANYLRQSDIVSGGIVALVMDKSPLLYCAILGILKTGCAYLPVLPSTPPQRIQLIFKQAQPQICLVDESFPRQIAEEVYCPVVNMSSVTLSEYHGCNLEIPRDQNDLAYVIYTSGTTGAPKGVSVTNANILSNIEALSRIYPHEPSDRMLQACSQAFDVSVFEIFFSWANGMCLCSATNDVLFEDIESAVRTLRVTHLSMTVTVASLLEPSRLPNVKMLVTSGEPMTDAVLETWARRLWQGYGPSETTNICTVRKVSQGDSSPYLGWPLENTSAFVFSQDSPELMPLGCVGELCFGGDQVAAGYLNMPELTSTKFFHHREYGRLYRSGDLGRMLPDGSLIILGRIDTQVKLRGLRIELQEIQAIALRSRLAKACTSVLATIVGASTEQLVLFYVPTSHERPGFSILPITDPIRKSIVTIQQTLRDALPDYMVPSFVIPISTLPLTSSGKIDHDSLRSSASDLSGVILNLCSTMQDVVEDSVEWTEIEVLLAGAISETLRVEKKVINRWGSFAALGIDSISAIPLARRLQTILGKRIPLSLILSNPSVGRLALAIAEDTYMKTVRPNEKTVALPQPLVEAVRRRFDDRGEGCVENILPCTPLQEAMLSSSRSSSGGSSYCNQMIFRLCLPSQTIKKYWDVMFKRHGILRTCFVTTEDARHPMVQVILASHSPTWKIVKADKANFQDLISRHGSSLPSALDNGEPPVSLSLFQLENSTEYLSFVCHHAVYDGVSMKQLLAEIEAVSRHEQLPAVLPFESFLQETLPIHPKADSFWEEQLHSFSPFRFGKLTSVNHPNPYVISGDTSRRPYSSVAARAQELGVSLLPLCQTAWAITLSLLQDNRDVCFGNVVSGRSIAIDQIDTLVAPCFNTVPMRMNISNFKFPHQVMNKFQRLNIEMMPYQFTSLRHIQTRLRLPYLFDTVLIVQPQGYALDGTVWSLEQEHGAMDVPLVCEITPWQDRDILTTQLHTDPSIFSRHISSLILDIFQDVFDACLERPSSHMPTISSLQAEQQSQISSLSASRELARTDAGSVAPDKYEIDESWSRTELIVRSVLARLVNIPEQRIGRHVSLYRFGLDSIGAVQLATLLRRESCVISAVDVIENPTCAGIASHLTTPDCEKARFVYGFSSFQDTVSKYLDRDPKLRKDYEALLPCTPTQQGMISQFLNSDGTHYFNYVAWVLRAGVDSRQIAKAWIQLAADCQILRTGFAPIDHKDSSYAMIIYPVADFSAPVSIRQSSSFDNLEWRKGVVVEVLENLSIPPWQVVVVVDHEPGRSTMHLAMHHALYDANSLRYLLRRLTETLSGVASGDSPSIHSALSACLDPAHSESIPETFWKAKAADLVISKFPVMTPLHVSNGASLTVSMTSNMSSNNLHRMSSQADVTVRAALQAAWARVLSSYLGETSITFGIVLDGRSTQEERDVIFPMVTTLPVVARNFHSNAELLEDMMRYNTSLRRHERTPLSKVQRWLGRPGSQLFDTIIAYQTTDRIEIEHPWEILEEAASVEYAVALEVVETTSGILQLYLTHQANILPTEQARLLLRQFDTLLADLLTFPRGHSDKLPRLTPDIFSILPAENQQIPPPADLLHQLIENSARRIPTSTALEFVSELGNPVYTRRWTYRELDEMGNRVADMLSHRNTPPGSIVATCFNKCPEAYFTILGILKAGCTFLSLDPSAPVSRLEFILSDSAASSLLIEPCLNDSLDLNTAVPTYTVTERELLNFSASLEPTTISPSTPCYCLYTSGTTGIPKGCLISHDNAVQAMLAFEQLFSGHWDAHSRWLQFASFHFDVSVLEQYWSWFVGITVVAAPKDLILADITATISSLDITHIDLTPSLAKLIHPDETPSLCRGIFITGGEQLRQEILQAWGPKGVIYNAYGPTEATIGVTMSRRVPSNGKPSNIGHQFPNVGTYVLEPGTEIPVLKGGVGELCVSGRLVGLGYLNRKDLTEERFPVLERYGERVYRTGDLVRVLHDGSFDFLGRADDQVKLRGQRLEIGEINHAIKSGLPNQVTDVVTLVTRYLGQDRDLLVSFLVPDVGSRRPTDLQIASDQISLNLSRAALAACRDRLPGYMVPTYVFCIPFIPLSANNKADTKRLKQLFAELPHDYLRDVTTGSISSERAINEKERLIALAISTITEVKDTEIHPSSSIFELGIDSINVARLAIALQSRGLALAAPSLILRHPQISHLSQALTQATPITLNRQTLQIKQSIRAQYHRNIGTVCRTLNIDRPDVEYIAPCTPLQEGMITRSKAAEIHSAYFNQFQIYLDAKVSVSRLRDCWDSIFVEHAVLRTTFFPTSDGYIQVATKKTAVPWFEVDPEEKDIAVLMSERRDRWIVSNQDILSNPIEIDYLKHDGKQMLLLRLFHAVYDGRSFELLLRRVNEKYFQNPPAHSPTFFEVLPYGPLLKHIESRPFWERMFKDSSFQPMPAITVQSGALDVSLSRVISISGLEAKRLALGVTHQTIVLSAWLVALHQHLGYVPTVGIVFSGRSLVFEGVENVIGPVFNTLPFRVDLTNHSNWISLVQEVQEYSTSILEYVHTPLRDVQKWCSKGKPLFDILLTFDRDDVLPTAEHRSSFWSSLHSTGIPDYALALEVVLLRDQSLQTNIVAQKNIATEDAISFLLEEFSQALITLADSDSDMPLPSGPTASSGSSTVSQSSYLVKSNLSNPEIHGSKIFNNSKAREARHEVALLAGLPDEEIQENTRFLELGLDSIDGIKLAARLKKIGIRITISELMKNPTFKSIVDSHIITDKSGDDDNDEIINLNSSSAFLRRCLVQDLKDLHNVTAILPPTPLQDFMVADMLLSDFRRYFNHDVLEISQNTDINRLKSAWTTVYANSPILRTTFSEIDSPNSKAAYCQIVRDQPFEFEPTVELSDLDDISTVIERARDRAAAANGTSDLFQLALVNTPNGRYLVLSVAHALYDGWSVELLHRDVQAAYDGHYYPRSAYEPYLAHLLFSFSTAGESFWADYLMEARPTILRPIINLPSSHTPTIYRSELLSALDPRSVKALCKRYHITPQVLAQGCWAPVLALISKSLDVIFGVVLSGRDTDEARNLLFPTMNTVPLRVILHGTIAEYFDYLQASMSDIMEFQHFPLREVQKLSKFKGQNIFNTLFLLQNTGDHTVGSDSAILRSVRASSAVDYPVCVEMEITEKSVVWRIAGDERYISSEDTNRILANVEHVLGYFSGDHADILEFDMSDKVSVCGLEPFEPDSDTIDGIKTTLDDEASREINAASLESPVLEVLSELSGIDKHIISLNHSIYYLGLDSISAIKASSMIRKRGLDVSVRDLLKAASIREIIDQVASHDKQSKPHLTDSPLRLDSILKQVEIDSLLKDAGLDEADVEAVLPALPMQVHMLSTWQNTNGLLFFPRFTFQLHGNTSFEAISEAWSILISETQAFRTHFVATKFTEIPFVQIIMKSKPIDYSKRSPPDIVQDHQVYEESVTPFFYIHVENLSRENYLMHLQIHHALYDAISLPILMSRFSEICEKNLTPTLSTYRPRWYEFVLNHYSPTIQQRRRKFWSAYLQGIAPMRILPPQNTSANIQKTRVISLFRRNEINDVSRVKMVGSAHGVTLQALFFAAYSKALAAIRQSDEPGEHDRDVIFGVYLANRTSFTGIEDVPFPTLSIVPLLVRKPLTQSVLNLAIEIQKDILEISSFENTSVSLWEIYAWTGIRIESSVNFLATPTSPSTAYTTRSVTMTEISDNPISTPDRDGSSWSAPRPNWRFTSQNEAMEAYMHTLDVEVAIREGKMDIGIFNPPFLSESQSQKVIEDIITILEAIH
ncbi:Hydroxamate-type ferrichrome siderophore peptide synthetase [Daldinia childiae]|uniref:Hydroxamate-type ferrichrome siderophore peptide synthetase n=1 Tax=Daldinia childiae TaxID=326645 RepID=UPI001445AE37|nr:Hydroxamate-type ferrichrome siderophore peptide synthetase [Daldinia childiae]KAF3068467.1 Hydroxamate-type ferrichrome siderophore peptide synthetase [Daldinia childiae]